MSIKFHPHAAIFDDRTNAVRVPAIVDNKLLICAVARDAITKVLRIDDGPADYLIDTYRRFQRAFHMLAIYKYRTNKLQPDGVLFISADDFLTPDPPWDHKKSPTLN